VSAAPRTARRPHVAVLALLAALSGAVAALDGCRYVESRESRAAATDSASAVPVVSGDSSDTVDAETATAALDSARRDTTLFASHLAPSRQRQELSPLADSLAAYLVFAPRTQRWFTAAARGKRLLVDIGRADTDVRKDSTLLAAYREAARQLSPLPVGAHLRLFGPWGTDMAEVSGFDVYNGRMVATLAAPPRVDSIARHLEPLAAAALHTDSSAAPTTDRCKRDSVARDSLPPELVDRVGLVGDSIEQRLRDEATPPYERLAASTRVRRSRALGCFGVGRLLVVISLRAGNNEWVREHFAVINDSGQVTPFRANDWRFGAHDAVSAMDADGDGVDDLVARGIAENAGTLSVLKLDTATRRLERLTNGFSWEAR
jgi:hypothetical protein